MKQGPPHNTGGDSTSAWTAIGVPTELITLAVEAFGDLDRGRQWIEILDKMPPRIVNGSFVPAYQDPAVLREIAMRQPEPTEFALWQEAGLGFAETLKWSDFLAPYGLGAQHYARWKAAGLHTGYLRELLPKMGFEEFFAEVDAWGDPSAGHNLLRMIGNEVSVDEFRELRGKGYTGDQISAWRKSRLPAEEWAQWIRHGFKPENADIYINHGLTADVAATWQSAGVSPKRALDFINRGVLPDTAAKWLKAGVYEGEVLDFMDLGASLEEAADFSRQGLSPWEIEQTSAGLVPIDFEAKRVQDALDQMPNVIEPGYFQFTLSSDPHGYGEKAYDIAFTWDGERSAQFYTDISMYTPGLSVMSSAPMRGTISWRNGRDLRIEYDSEAASQEGTAVLKNQAPTLVDDLISDEASRDPRRWVELADQLIALEYDL